MGADEASDEGIATLIVTTHTHTCQEKSVTESSFSSEHCVRKIGEIRRDLQYRKAEGEYTPVAHCFVKGRYLGISKLVYHTTAGDYNIEIEGRRKVNEGQEETNSPSAAAVVIEGMTHTKGFLL